MYSRGSFWNMVWMVEEDLEEEEDFNLDFGFLGLDRRTRDDDDELEEEVLDGWNKLLLVNVMAFYLLWMNG